MADGAVVVGSYESYPLTVHGNIIVGGYEPYDIPVRGMVIVGYVSDTAILARPIFFR